MKQVVIETLSNAKDIAWNILKVLISYKGLFVAWLILGGFVLVLGVTNRFTFGCVLLLYLAELLQEIMGEEEDKDGE